MIFHLSSCLLEDFMKTQAEGIASFSTLLQQVKLRVELPDKALPNACQHLVRAKVMIVYKVSPYV
jgi:hypothetical protein